MFSKLLIASTACLTADALRVSNKAELFRVNESCGANIARWSSPNETQDFRKYSGGGTLYNDPDFPADESSLFWR